ncbi:MAG: metallophosphatase domain-containing protein [Candidatus Obscuribacterales bacterium]|nr:metallophosphatase domain-containing protein [Candidatus Obscuribacterales bacterium]
MKIVIVSDTHNRLSEVKIPDGDILIHCGDFSMAGNAEEFEQFARDMEELPHKYKIVIAGNHELLFEAQPMNARGILRGVTYLQDEAIEIEGLKIYGSPWQPEFGNWAFNLPRNSPLLMQVWEKIPRDVNVLITHTPPHGILDKTREKKSVGCEVLRQRLKDLRSVKLHCFGHIHPAYGKKRIGDTLFVNAAIVDDKYKPANQPISCTL